MSSIGINSVPILRSISLPAARNDKVDDAVMAAHIANVRVSDLRNIEPSIMVQETTNQSMLD